MWVCLKTEELRWGSPTATPPFEPLMREQKGSGFFFSSMSEPRINGVKCWKKDLTPFVQLGIYHPGGVFHPNAINNGQFDKLTDRTAGELRSLSLSKGLAPHLIVAQN